MDLKTKHLQSRHCSYPHFWLREAASMCPGRKVPGPNCTMRGKASAGWESICSPPVFCCASETCWQAPQLSNTASQETLAELTSYKDLSDNGDIYTDNCSAALFLLNLNRWHWLSHQTRFLIISSLLPLEALPSPPGVKQCSTTETQFKVWMDRLINNSKCPIQCTKCYPISEQIQGAEKTSFSS